jgi:predicted glycoside hydrolase/deacetylase ChbG (UPF0249 family)
MKLLKKKPAAVVINADDFGLNEAVNAEIIRLLGVGKLSSATILANAPAADEAIYFASKNRKLGFGVHLNMTDFSPLSGEAKASKFVSFDGYFDRSFESKVSFLDKNIIYAEWSAQIAKLLSRGVRVSHLDSHHHIHTRPEAFFALKKLQRKYNINKLRRPRNIIPSNERNLLRTKLKMGLKSGWTFAARCYPAVSSTTAWFGSLFDFIQVINERDRALPLDGSIELMCHPGAAKSRFAEQYHIEGLCLEAGLNEYLGVNFQYMSYLSI